MADIDKTIKDLAASAKGSILAAKTPDELEAARIKYLGRKGELPAVLKGLKDRTEDERRSAGLAANALKNELESLIASKASSLGVFTKTASSPIDVTLPGFRLQRGRLHPITLVLNEVKDVFKKMGYCIAAGPDIETDYYNFEALNIPPDHPARDMWSTLYVENGLLLRTHTSPVQIRVMEKEKPPLAMIVPGRVYRRDADITHSPVFHQVEGLLVDKGINFGHLKGTLTAFLRQVFGKTRKVRFRPSYFPFTEPSAEVDVECILCNGLGCKVCKGTGWLEILGAGMVDPAVFKYVNYDPEEFTGFAFGMGIERIAMLKYGIDDIRLFYEDDIRFLSQF
jgi:phenylalanyl-tRNA synthetase alpha chain